MYPRRSNTRVKGPFLNTPTHSPPHTHTMNQPLSHIHTQGGIHTHKCILCTYTQIQVPPSLLAACPPEEIWDKARGKKNKRTRLWNKPAEP